MNRRTLLGRLVMGAAAALGVGMAAPKAEAAQGCPDPWCPCHFDMSPARAEALKADFEAGLGTWSDVSPVTGFNVAPKTYTRYSYPITSDRDLAQAKADAYERGRSVAEARAESRLAEGLPIRRDALTFGEVQAELTDNMARAADPVWLIRWGQMLAECPNAWPTNGEPPKALCAPGWCAPCDVWR